MKVVPIGDPLTERREDFDQRQKTTVAEGACFLCGGWGYPVLDFFPQSIDGKIAVRVRSEACNVCGGSGLNPKRHEQAEIDAGRKYHQARIERLLRLVSQDVQRRAAEASRK